MRTLHDTIPRSPNQQFNTHGTFHGEQLKTIGLRSPTLTKVVSGAAFRAAASASTLFSHL
jgi:hypothetical protein